MVHITVGKGWNYLRRPRRECAKPAAPSSRGVYEREERGHPPHHPVMMVKVLLYAYCVGLPSSRRIGRGLVEDAALRYLAANNTPDFKAKRDELPAELAHREGRLKKIQEAMEALERDA